MVLRGKTAIVTGGTRGLGKGMVEALLEQGVDVTTIARHADAPAQPGLRVIQADVTDQAAANRLAAEHRPDILVLNAGAEPHMASLDEIGWEEFSTNWNIDVKGGLFWIQAALNTPLRPGSRVIVVSSGAAIGGSPLSGGYGGAKRMLWFMAKYANSVSVRKNLGLLFQAVAPLQMVAGTGVGSAGSRAYARVLGIEPESFIARMGPPMPPRMAGDHVVQILSDPAYDDVLVLGLRGDSGISVLEEATP